MRGGGEGGGGELALFYDSCWVVVFVLCGAVLCVFLTGVLRCMFELQGYGIVK